MIHDLPYIFYWWLIVFGLGILVFPLTKIVFSKFFDLGYPFAKILGILLTSYLVWLLASLKILPFFRETIGFVIIILAIINLLIFTKTKKNFLFGPTIVSSIRRIFIFEEVLFFLAFLFWVWVRAHEPSIHGLEKFMDYGFINSILRSNFFPPADMWLSPSPDPRYTGSFTINYYYFGHLTAAVLTKLSGIDSAITYNLVLATLFGLCFSGAFSIGGNLIYLFLHPLIPSKESKPTAEKGVCKKPKRRGGARKFFLLAISKRLRAVFKNHKDSSPAVPELKNFRRRPQRLSIAAGLLTSFLLTLAGNLHTIYVFKDPSRYWYPDATRFIPFTIHEFPSYSWVVADLHGHVFDIPFVLLAIAILLSLITNFQLLITILLGLVLAVLYMTNAWDGIIYLGLSGLVILGSYYHPKRLTAQPPKMKNFNFLTFVLTFSFLAFIFFLFCLPFNLSFTPFVKGIGVNCPPSFAPERLGPFLFEKGNCQKSPLYMLAILWGFFYFNAVAFLVFILRKEGRRQGLRRPDIFILLMIFLSTFLIAFPEFFYAKDIYPAHFRANTMFKLGYQAFIMMSIASSYIIVGNMIKLKESKNQRIKENLIFGFWILMLLPQLFLVGIYPLFAINSYYGNLKIYHGLDGTAWFKNQYPDDFEAILWLKKLEPRTLNFEPVLVEAVGESYTDYARVSSYTGLPTILGWPVHEWLWRGSFDEPGKRISEVQTIYESENLDQVKDLLKKYNVSFIFLGTLEREKYKNLNEEKFGSLGKLVFESGRTRVYQVSNSGYKM